MFERNPALADLIYSRAWKKPQKQAKNKNKSKSDPKMRQTGEQKSCDIYKNIYKFILINSANKAQDKRKQTYEKK